MSESSSYLSYDHSMRFIHLYDALPGFWEFIGRHYPFWDIIGGICFLIGSILFTIPPLVEISRSELDRDITRSDLIFLAGVIILTVGKAFIETKAMYSEFWERPAKRAGWTYHVGVLLFFIGGVLFGGAVFFELSKRFNAGIWLGLWSGVFFAVGGAVFIVNSIEKELVTKSLWDFHNFTIYVSVFLMAGGVFYVFSEACALNIGKKAPESVQFEDIEFCSYAGVKWFSLFGGVGFIIGSGALLVFGIFEYVESLQGEDPRTVTHYGEKRAHPFRPREGTRKEHLDPQPSKRYKRIFR